MRLLFSFAAALCLLGFVSATARSDQEPQADQAPFTVEIQGMVIDHEVFFAPVLPGELLTIQVRGRPEDHRQVRFSMPKDGDAVIGLTKASWRAPEQPGHQTIQISETGNDQVFVLNVFVMHPHQDIENESLNGYRIGTYPEKPLRGLDAYKRPEGFIAVNDETKDLKVSPHFRLGQFVCKQSTKADERYLVLRPALLQKLEATVDLLEEQGFEPDTLFVMSGYRTPFYNKAIGNVPYSRHVYGDAADVYLDVSPRDGDMDDLDRDGHVTKADAAYLYDLVAAADRKRSVFTIQGGIGAYDRNSAHGPFVHIDTRGTPARWGR